MGKHLRLLAVLFFASLYAQSDFERMVEKAAVAQYVNEHHDDYFGYSKDDYEPREPVSQDAHSDYCYTHIEQVNGSDFSYTDYWFFDPLTKEQYHKHEEKLYTVCAVEPPAGSETREPIFVPVELAISSLVSLGPIVQEAVNCSIEHSTLTAPEQQPIVRVQEIPTSSPFEYEKPEKLDYYAPDDNFPSDPGHSFDCRPRNHDEQPAAPLLKRYSSADEFAKPWRQSGVNKIIQRYQALSADDFEQLFLIHTVPVDQRTAAYYNAMPFTDQLFIFMQLELYQFKEFRIFLTRFPQCKRLCEKALTELQWNVTLIQRIKRSGVHAGKDPFYAPKAIIHNFLSEVEALQVQQQREAQCVNMVVHQRDQRIQLQELATVPGNPCPEARTQRLQQSLDEDFLLHAAASHVSDAVKSVLQEYGLAQTFYIVERGTPIQLQLQTECLSILERIAQEKTESASVKALHATVVATVDSAHNYTLNGFVLQAMAWTDTAYSLLVYAQYCCENTRNKGIYWATRAEHAYARHEYAQAAAQSLASIVCRTFAACDYLLAAGQGIVQGTQNTAHLLHACGTTIINTDKEAISKACNTLLEKLGASCAYLTLWDDIEWNLLIGNEAAAQQKLQRIAPDVEAINHAAADCLQQLKKSSNQDIVCTSFKMATEGVLLGKMVQVVHGLFAAAQVEVASITAAQSTEQSLALVQESYNLHLTNLFTANKVVPLADGTITIIETAQTMQPQDGMAHLYSLLLGKEFPTDVVISAITGAAVTGLNERSGSDERYHVPKHQRKSILAHTPPPEDPKKNKKDKKEQPNREKGLPQVDTYEQARNKALEIIGDVDPHTAEPHIGTVGIGEGQITGLDWHGEKVSLRLDWDPTKGPHINVTDCRMGKGSKVIKIYIPFKGDFDTVNSLYRHMNNKASIQATIEKLKRAKRPAKLELLIDHLKKKGKRGK